MRSCLSSLRTTVLRWVRWSGVAPFAWTPDSELWLAGRGPGWGAGPALTSTASRIGNDDDRQGASSSTAISDWNAVGRCHH
jgi:hypothetical protein